MKYEALYEFTELGLDLFNQVFTDRLGESAINLNDPDIAQPLAGTAEFEVVSFATAKEMAAAILTAAGPCTLAELLPRTGLWAWLAFVLRDVIFPQGADGKRAYKEVHRWYPSNPGDYQKWQRHLVRMPVFLLSTLGKNADHLLCGVPSTLPEIREQLTSQQDMLHPSFQGAARILYYDDEKNKLKYGTGGKSGGSPRRLAKVRQQLDVTWDLFVLPPERLVEMLPREFNRFKPDTFEESGEAPRSSSGEQAESTRLVASGVDSD